VNFPLCIAFWAAGWLALGEKLCNNCWQCAKLFLPPPVGSILWRLSAGCYKTNVLQKATL